MKKLREDQINSFESFELRGKFDDSHILNEEIKTYINYIQIELLEKVLEIAKPYMDKVDYENFSELIKE